MSNEQFKKTKSLKANGLKPKASKILIQLLIANG